MGGGGGGEGEGGGGGGEERRFILGGLCSSPGVSHVYALSHNRVSLMLSVLYYFACMVYGLGRGN